MVAAVGVSSTGRQRREWHRRAGCGGAAAVWQQQCGRGGSVAAAAVWRRRPGGIGVTVSAWRCGSSGRAAVVWHHQRTSSRGGPMWRERCGSSGVAAAADGSSWAEPAGDDQSGGRACVRAGAQTWLAHLRGRQRGRGERASGRWRAFFDFTMPSAHGDNFGHLHVSTQASTAGCGQPDTGQVTDKIASQSRLRLPDRPLLVTNAPLKASLDTPHGHSNSVYHFPIRAMGTFGHERSRQQCSRRSRMT